MNRDISVIEVSWANQVKEKSMFLLNQGPGSLSSICMHVISINKLHIVGATLQPQGNEPGQRDTMKNHGRLGSIHAKHQDTLPSAWRDRCTTPLWHMVQRPGHSPNKHRTNLWPHRPKWKEVHTCMSTQREVFEGQTGSHRAKRVNFGKGGSGGPSPENLKKLHCKWCNLRYSWAIFVNIISLYCNKTCINYASFITI